MCQIKEFYRMLKNQRKVYYSQSIERNLYAKLLIVAKKHGVKEQLFVELLIKKALDKISIPNGK